MTEEEEVNEILWEQRRKELAAEEMYEALREALEAIAWHKAGAFQGSDGQPIWGRIQAALAKAEGR